MEQMFSLLDADGSMMVTVLVFLASATFSPSR